MQDTTFLLGGWTDRLDAWSWQNRNYDLLIRQDTEQRRSNRINSRLENENRMQAYRHGVFGYAAEPAARGDTFRGNSNPRSSHNGGSWPAENRLRRADSWEDVYRNGGRFLTAAREYEREFHRYGGGSFGVGPFLEHEGVGHLVDFPFRDRDPLLELPQPAIQENVDMYYRARLVGLQAMPLPQEGDVIDRNNPRLRIPRMTPFQSEQVTKWQAAIIRELAPRLQMTIREIEDRIEINYEWEEVGRFWRDETPSEHHGRSTFRFNHDPSFLTSLDYSVELPDRAESIVNDGMDSDDDQWSTTEEGDDHD